MRFRAAVGSVRRRNTDEPVISPAVASSAARRNTNATSERPRMRVYQGPQGEQSGLGMFDDFGETPPVLIKPGSVRSPVIAPPVNPPLLQRPQGSSSGSGMLDEFESPVDGPMLDARGNPMKTTIAKMQSLRSSAEETQDTQLTTSQTWPRTQRTNQTDERMVLPSLTTEPLAMPKMSLDHQTDFEAGSPDADRAKTSDSRQTNATASTDPISPILDQSSTRATSLFSTSPDLSRTPHPKTGAPPIPLSTDSTSNRTDQTVSRQPEAMPIANVQVETKDNTRAIPHKKISTDLPRHSSTVERPPSRRSERIMNFVRPRGSMDSVRSSHSERPKVSGWGLFRRNSKDAGRPASANGHSKAFGSQSGAATDDIADQKDTPPKVNKNRKLPPLPSLDTWSDPKESEKVTHIASLVSPTKTHQSVRPVIEDARQTPAGTASKFAEDVDRIEPVVSVSSAQPRGDQTLSGVAQQGKIGGRNLVAKQSQESSYDEKANAHHVELASSAAPTDRSGLGSKLARLLGRKKKGLISKNGCSEAMRDPNIMRNNEGIA